MTGPGGTADPFVGSPKVEMIYTAGFFPGSGLPTFGDPMNIRTGEQVQFQLVRYTQSGARVVVTPEGWRVSDTTQTYGVIASNTGIFQASTRQSDISQVVTARFSDQDYSVSYSVRPRQIRIIGSILNRVTHLPVPNVTMYFYDVNGVYLGPATTTYDGSFRAAMPSSVARFQIVNDTLPDTVFRLMRHDSTLSVQTTSPDYLFNRNSSGTPVAVSFDQTGMQWRLTGVGQTCLPLLSASSYVNTDYYLAKPILVAPFGDVDDLNNPIDPDLLAEGCTVP